MYEGERRCAILWSGRVKQRSQSNFSNIKGEGDTHFKSNQKVVSKLNLNFCKLKYKSKQNEMFNRIKKNHYMSNNVPTYLFRDYTK